MASDADACRSATLHRKERSSENPNLDLNIEKSMLSCAGRHVFSDEFELQLCFAFSIASILHHLYRDSMAFILQLVKY